MARSRLSWPQKPGDPKRQFLTNPPGLGPIVRPDAKVMRARADQKKNQQMPTRSQEKGGRETEKNLVAAVL